MSATDVETWWRRLGSAALVGTARRPVPAISELNIGAGTAIKPRADAKPEEAALDAVALGGSLRRAGQLPQASAPVPPAAPADTHPQAPPLARQLLELLLVQPPTDAAATDVLLQHWCAECHEAGHRVPYRLLPALLDRARSKELRRHVVPVAGRRGAWLAEQNPQWAWLSKEMQAPSTDGEPAAASDDAHSGQLDADQWALLDTDQRAAQLRSLRRYDPAGARDLMLTTWSSEPAKDRRTLLETLLVGLSPDDEDVLERALDDRAGSVRELAGRLLDGLPTSRRAARMAQRLRPLVSESRLRRNFEFRLPDDPDAASRRDGLGKPPPGRGARGWWLTQMVAGAPFDVWDGSAAKVVPKIQDPDVLAGLRRAAVLRRDSAWARALLGNGTDPELLAVLLPEERASRVLDEIGHTEPAKLPAVLGSLSRPWPSQLSIAVVEKLARLKPESTGPLLDTLVPLLVRGLHQDAVPALQGWRAKARLPHRYDAQLGSLIQSHTLRQTISEAFQ